MSLALRNLRQLPAHAEAIGVVADEAQLGVPGPDLEHALRLLRLAIHARKGFVYRSSREERVARLLEEEGLAFEREVRVDFEGGGLACLDFLLRMDWGLCALEVDEGALVLLQVGGLVEAAVALGAGVRAHVLVGDARVLVERLLVAEGLRALRALERLLAEVHRLEVGPHDAGAREDLGALGARLGGHGCELLRIVGRSRILCL